MTFKTVPSPRPRLVSRSPLRAAVAACLMVGSQAFAAAPGPTPVVVVGQTPVETYVTATSAGTSSFDNLLYTVPAGKMLVVESVTLLDTIPETGVGLTAVLVNSDATSTITSLASVSAPAVSATAASTQPMHMHVTAGHTLVANVFRTGGTTLSAFVSLSGHLEAAP